MITKYFFSEMQAIRKSDTFHNSWIVSFPEYLLKTPAYNLLVFLCTTDFANIFSIFGCLNIILIHKFL